MVVAATSIACLSLCWAFGRGMGVAKLVAPGKGREGVGIYGRCCRGCCGDGGDIGSSLLFCLLVLLTPGLEQFAVVRRDWYLSWDWSWSRIQSLTSWYHMACCRTMIFSIFCVWG